MDIKSLSDLNVSAVGMGRRLNACVVSSEFLGPIKGGGIATATSALAKQLSSEGHYVTLLYTLVHYGRPIDHTVQEKGADADASWQRWVDLLANDNIGLDHIRHDGDYRAWLERSWHVKEFIEEHEFDLVYFDDFHASGYYSLLAKRSGLEAFCNTTFCIITHASMEWVSAHNDSYMRCGIDLELAALERRCVELADVVIGPSRYLLNEYERYGWRLPARTYWHPYPLLRAPLELKDEPIWIGELVFFGRLETRKGLWLFCEALDRMDGRLREKTVTFLGKVAEDGISSITQILNRSAHWPCKIQIITDFDRDQALAYLKEGGRLAIMPSLADNSPCTVYECMEAGVPFVSTCGSGTQELVDHTSWPAVMVQPSADALAQKLDEIVASGARLARPAFDPQHVLQTWRAWHQYIAQQKDGAETESIVTKRRDEVAQNVRAQYLALLVIVDDESCSLRVLIANLVSHLRRFGGRASHLVITGRSKAILTGLQNLFTHGEGSQVQFLAPSEQHEVHSRISECEFVFFADASVEVLTPFMILALGTLAYRRSSVVSCMGAVQYTGSNGPQIELFPIGDVSGAAASLMPICGPVWACASEVFRRAGSDLKFYDSEGDRVLGAVGVGETCLHVCLTAEMAIDLVPIVGATETRGRRHRSRSDAYQYAKVRSNLGGVVPSLYKGGPAWLAIAGSHARSSAVLPPGEAVWPVMPAEHPLMALRASLDATGLPEWAAALGRPELALQLAASTNASPERLRELVGLAVKSMRARPSLDLAECLESHSVAQFGRGPIPDQIDADKQSEVVAIFVDSRLKVTGRWIESNCGLNNEGPAKVFFFDTPLSGNSALAIRLHANRSDPFFFRIRIIDQSRGGQIGETSGRLSFSERYSGLVPLQNIYGYAVVVLEFSGPIKLNVAVDQLELLK